MSNWQILSLIGLKIPLYWFLTTIPTPWWLWSFGPVWYKVYIFHLILILMLSRLGNRCMPRSGDARLKLDRLGVNSEVAPDHWWSQAFGYHCLQFTTFFRSSGARWTHRCLEGLTWRTLHLSGWNFMSHLIYFLNLLS